MLQVEFFGGMKTLGMERERLKLPKEL